MHYVGADRCPAGWFWVGFSARDTWRVGVAEDASTLWSEHHDAERILIDIPIGLLEEGEAQRPCDARARELLGPDRAPSVFTPPCRPAVYAGGPEEAARVNEERTGRGLPAQTRALLGRIREVDELLRAEPGARERVRETHPEVAFWGLNRGRTVPAPKREREGMVERLAVLDAHDARAPRVVSASLLAFPRNAVGRDDVLDALAAAVVASRRSGLRTLPPEPPADEQGLEMEIVLWCPPEADLG